MLDQQNLASYRGAQLQGPDGKKIGKIDEIYLDDQTGNAEWALVNTGMFGTKSSFVPLREADDASGAVQVPYDGAKVKDAPRLDADEHLSEEEERQLWQYYGLDYDTQGEVREGHTPEYSGTAGYGTTETTGRTGTTDTTTETTGTRDMSETAGQTGYDTSGPSTDDAMTRSEERVNIGTEQREAGRARLRKYMVTENVTKTVPVSREEVRIEREPITDANRGDAHDGPALSEEEHEVVLHEEVPVVDKQVEPVERIRLDTETVQGETTVDEEVRKEQVTIDEPQTAGVRPDGDTTRDRPL